MDGVRGVDTRSMSAPECSRPVQLCTVAADQQPNIPGEPRVSPVRVPPLT